MANIDTVFWKMRMHLRLLLVILAFLVLAPPSFLQGQESSPVQELRTGWMMHAGDPSGESGPWQTVDAYRQTPAPDRGLHGGIAWFRMDFPGSSQPMALALNARRRALEIFWDGRSIGRAGAFGPLLVPGPKDRVLVFPLPPGPGIHRLEVRVQVGLESQYLTPFTGFDLSWKVIAGPVKAVRQEAEMYSYASEGFRWRSTIAEFTLGVAFLMAGLWHLQHFLVRRQNRELLWFGAGSLLTGLRQFWLGAWLPDWPLPAFRVYQAALVLSFLICVVLVEFMRCLASDAVARRLRGYQWTFLLPLGAIFLLSPAWAMWVAERVGPLWVLPVPIAFCGILLHRRRLQDPDAKFLLGGSMLLGLALVYDLAHSLGFGPDLNASSWAFALIVCSMAVLANMRSTRAQDEALGLARELDAQIQERQRLSRELHDGIGGHLSSAILLVENLARQKDPGEVSRRLPMMGEVLGQCMEELRSLMWILQDREAALADLALELQERLTRRLSPHGVTLDFSAHFDHPAAPLSRTIRFHVLRIVQE